MKNQTHQLRPPVNKEETEEPADSTPIPQNTLQDQPSDSPPISSHPSDESNQIVKIISKGLNVRKGPDKSHPILFRLTKDTKVEVVNDENDAWYLIRASGDRLGYVMRVFVVPVES